MYQAVPIVKSAAMHHCHCVKKRPSGQAKKRTILNAEKRNVEFADFVELNAEPAKVKTLFCSMKPRSFSFSFSLVLVLSLSLIKEIVLARSWLKVRQMLGIQHELILACTVGLHPFAKEDRLKQLQLQKRQRDKHKEAFEDNTRETLVEKRRKHGKKCNTDVLEQF